MLRGNATTDRRFTDLAEILERAALNAYPISRAIVTSLSAVKSMSIEALHRALFEKLRVDIREPVILGAIDFTNEKLHLIDNLDPNHEVLLAHIHGITVEVDGMFFVRYVLVHN